MFYVPDPRVTCHCTRSDLMAIGTNWRRSSGGGGGKCCVSLYILSCWSAVAFIWCPLPSFIFASIAHVPFLPSPSLRSVMRLRPLFTSQRLPACPQPRITSSTLFCVYRHCMFICVSRSSRFLTNPRVADECTCCVVVLVLISHTV
jgi:hypothetical protein